MSSFLSDPSEYNIQTENEINIILAQANPDLLLSVITDNIQNLYTYGNMSKPNIVASFEDYFKQLSNVYSDLESLQSISNKRYEVYNSVIDILCRGFNFSYDIDNINDIYSAAYYLYDLLVGNFNYNIVQFFTNYIIKEKNSIYDSFNLNDMKKEKDSLTAYSKKLYKNNKIAIIAANIDYVVNQMKAIDISFDTVLNIIYADKNISKFIQNIFVPNDNFYQSIIVPILSSPIRSIILSNIQIELQNRSITEEMQINNMI